ncbi:MAG: DUF4350 domain-containing protein [Bacteroidota bacterium]
MRKEWKLYAFLGGMFVIYVVLNYYAPKPLKWQPTFHPVDKAPYGGFVLFDRISDLFDRTVQISDLTLYELQDSTGSVLVLAMQPALFDADLQAILERVSEGAEVLVAGERFSEETTDTLSFATNSPGLFRLPNATDTTEIQFEGGLCQLSDVLVQTYFELPDTTQWDVLAETTEPVLIARDFGKGRLILSSTPLAFSNFALLQDHRLAEHALTQLSNDDLHFTHYYQTGKIQSSSPFRYVLTEASLTWALYLGLLTITCLLVFDAQRRQRAVRVVQPPINSTVQFVKTVGALFYRERNNHKMAEKLARYFQEELYRKYHKTPTFSEKYYDWLSHKSGLSKTEVIQTFQSIQQLDATRQISDKQLITLNEQLSAFIR